VYKKSLHEGEEIRVSQGPTGVFVSFPAKKQRDGSQLAYPANAETRMMIQRVILAEYEKWIRDISE
jgi:DNA-binding cell septation regulator SpoVG